MNRITEAELITGYSAGVSVGRSKKRTGPQVHISEIVDSEAVCPDCNNEVSLVVTTAGALYYVTRQTEPGWQYWDDIRHKIRGEPCSRTRP